MIILSPLPLFQGLTKYAAKLNVDLVVGIMAGKVCLCGFDSSTYVPSSKCQSCNLRDLIRSVLVVVNVAMFPWQSDWLVDGT